jgi:hypothetical protein
VVSREARGAEVDDLDLAARVGLDEDILGLEIAVDQVEAVHEAQGVEALRGDASQAGEGEVRLTARLAVVAGELVEVVAQQLAHDEEVLLVGG